MSNNIEQYVFDNVLLENEKLLWKGKSEPEISPKAILALNGRLKITFWSIFTFIWGIISLEILGDIFEGEDLIVILVVSIMPCTFTYFGIRILYLSPRKKLLQLQNTYYGITDRRILIMEFSDKIKIVPIEKMARNFTAYPSVAPKVRVYGHMVFKFNPSSFTSKSGKQ